MSDEQGSVHYQISITGRQAAAFFFLLLTALGLAFFFGMKTGAAARRVDEPVSVARIEAPATNGAARPKDDEIGFAPKATATPKPEPTAVPERPAARPTAVKPTAIPPPLSTSPRAEVPTPSTSGPPVRPSVTPRVAVTPRTTPSPAITPEKTPAKKPAAFYVQVFATNNAARVDEIAKGLKAKGFKADVSAVPNRPGFFRVRVGPYPDKAKAEAASKKIMQADPSIKKPIIGP